MPRILVVADTPDAPQAPILLAERVMPDVLASAHYARQLLERIRWAAQEAEAAEGELTPPRRRGPVAVSPGWPASG